jgi:ABC-type transport system involved in multi-copper enzyme maturation permease subunit
MSTTALTGSRRRARDNQRPHPLLSVLVWELRRFRASRIFWLQALGFFCLSLFFVWATQKVPDSQTLGTPSPCPTCQHITQKVPDSRTRTGNVPFTGFVAGTSAWGLLLSLPAGLFLLPGLLLPFVNAEGVTRDLNRRTHELLMTTALPSWAYVWGRFLMGLLLSLGLALLLLVAILGMGVLLHLTVPAYPLPPAGAVLLLWVGMVVPATIVISSFSFALGTVLPRQATLVKIVILLGWFIGVVILPSGLVGDTSSRYGVSAWYRAWDPTSATTAFGMSQQYRPDLMNQIATATNAAQVQNALLSIENRLPDVGIWFAPHLIEALLSLLLVVPAALTFRRFRNTFHG